MANLITFEHKGSFEKTSKFLERHKNGISVNILHKYGAAGVAALKRVTPVDTYATASHWYYTITQKTPTNVSVNFCNDYFENGCHIAIILQYGHATKNGGWVAGRDYINPALHPIFENALAEVWKEVIR